MSSAPAGACHREQLVEVAAHLPAAPQVLAEINELLLDPHLQLDDVVAVLRRDATLASTVVRIANSALYAGPRLGAIEDAVARVGLTEVFRVVGLATTARLSALSLPTYGLRPGELGRNALLHALAVEALAPFVGVDGLVAYTAGLLRPLGLLVIDQLMRPSGGDGEAVFVAPDPGATEQERVGRTSPEVAALVLEAWRFSPIVVEAVRDQYLTGDAAGVSPLAVTLNLAGGLVAEMGGALPVERTFWRTDRATCELVGLHPDQLAVAQEQAWRQYERQRSAVE